MHGQSRERSLLIHNAQIYLFDENDTTAEAILIEHGRIAGVGPSRELRRQTGWAPETWDARAQRFCRD